MSWIGGWLQSTGVAESSHRAYSLAGESAYPYHTKMVQSTE